MAISQLYARSRKLAKILKRRPYLRGLSLGTAAGVEHEQLLKRLNFSTVVDIGANRGQFALVARYCFPDARIFSFEPLGGPAKHFNSVFIHDSNTVLFRKAIGEDSKHVEMHVSARDDSSSLLPLSAEQLRIFPETKEVTTQVVEVGPLSKFLSTSDIRPPALLKLDVQGYELQSLKGCDEMLDLFTHAYVECSYKEMYMGQALADDVVEWLKNRGYTLAERHNVLRDRDSSVIQADLLFEKT